MASTSSSSSDKVPQSAQDFWDAASSMISVTENHPFLVAMVDGSLEVEQFKYYVVQDALYLQDFADCLRRLSRMAPTEVDQNRLEQFAVGAEEAEMSLHNSFFVEWNISAEGATQMPNCLLYTSYMKRVVATQSYAQGLSVLLPCFWVYMHVGKCMLQLRAVLGDTVSRPPPFDAWIDMYGGEEFEKEVRDYIGMVNDACQTLQSEANNGIITQDDANKELNEMLKHFIMSCKLEHMFWDQATTMLKWPEIGGM